MGKTPTKRTAIRRCPQSRREHSIEEMGKLAKLRRGECLSAEYKGSRQKLLWTCHQGHQWCALPGNVIRGSWCPYCARRVRASIEEMRLIALSRGGQCISDSYKNRRTLLRWRCSEGHTWSAPASAITAGKWCARCASVAKYTIDDMRRLALERGGSCNPTAYQNVRARLAWTCAKGHTWRTTAASVAGGRWCPLCARNQRLELAEMQRFAARKHGRCLSPVYVNHRTHLMWQRSQGHRWMASPHNVRREGARQGTWCPTCAEQARRFRDRLTLEEIQEIAVSRGGRCISDEYLGSKFKLTWQCSLGHTWRAFVTPVRRGSWCPTCAGNQKLTLEFFQNHAQERGGTCLSPEYVNGQAPLTFQCAAGHIWKTTGADVKRGSWCGMCAYAGRRSRFKAKL